jgi:integrase/recombinase XerD
MRVESVYARVRALTRRQPDLPAGWSPHWLRHTHATALLLSGRPVHVVMRRLGHLDIQTTVDIYGWVTEDAEMATVANWTAYVDGWRGLHDAG